MPRLTTPTRWLAVTAVVCVLAGVACTQHSPAQPPPPGWALVARGARVPETKAITEPTSVAELQGSGRAPDGAAADAAAAPTLFPDRTSIEALDRISHGVLRRQDEHGAVLGLGSDGVFETGSAELAGGARWTLDDMAAALAMQHGRRIHVRVYTDSMGDRAESMHLSQHRAETLRDYFIARGVNAGQIDAEGLGPARAVADNRTTEGRAANRRIEIEIVIEAPRAR